MPSHCGLGQYGRGEVTSGVSFVTGLIPFVRGPAHELRTSQRSHLLMTSPSVGRILIQLFGRGGKNIHTTALLFLLSTVYLVFVIYSLDTGGGNV